MKVIRIKRIYAEPSDDDGYRILVDRLWPRGISKESARLNEWNKDIAPSPDLRKWFDHQEARFQEFARLYREELKDKKNELNRLREIAKNKKVSLLYAAKDPELNQAVVLRDLLLKQ